MTGAKKTKFAPIFKVFFLISRIYFSFFVASGVCIRYVCNAADAISVLRNFIYLFFFLCQQLIKFPSNGSHEFYMGKVGAPCLVVIVVVRFQKYHSTWKWGGKECGKSRFFDEKTPFFEGVASLFWLYFFNGST